jgi:hypothetical protein
MNPHMHAELAALECLFADIQRTVDKRPADQSEHLYLFFLNRRMSTDQISSICRATPEEVASTVNSFLAELLTTSDAVRQFLMRCVRPETSIGALCISPPDGCSPTDLQKDIHLLTADCEMQDSVGARLRDLIGTAIEIGTPPLNPELDEKVLFSLHRAHREFDSPDVPREQRLNVPHRGELDRLLSELRVTESSADMRRGRFWCVYAQPCVREPERKTASDNIVDILVHVVPLGGGEQVCVEGMRVTLTNEAGTVCYIQGRTDHRGQVCFPDVVPGCYHGALERRQFAAHGAAKEFPISVAASAKDEGFRRYALPDRRLFIVLERGSRGKAVLTIRTEDQSLADALVHYTVGSETGEVKLRAADSAGVWECWCDLEQTFEDAVRGEPGFEIRHTKSKP